MKNILLITDNIVKSEKDTLLIIEELKKSNFEVEKLSSDNLNFKFKLREVK